MFSGYSCDPWVGFVVYLWLAARAHEGLTFVIWRFNLASLAHGVPVKCLYLC